ncbi:ACP7 [Bugula neritina]|uniref:Purple acid phosphatase n=1 Tax=Bugula neritina TaxID=10212 RepID=A0A7J7JQX1_BUGNE|nr:ACP7 [Bugula neritina]
MTASYISVVKLAIFISASSLVCCLPQSGKHDLTLQVDPPDQRYPQHVHLSLGVAETEMVVTWTTFQETPGAAEYSLPMSPQKMTVPSTVTIFIDGGDEHRKYYIHRAHMTHLKPSQVYSYRGDENGGWSPLFSFRATPSGPNWSPVVAVYGDLGNRNGRSIGRLQTEAQYGTINAVFHIGDFAYDMQEDNGRVGDDFMAQIESIAGYVPYMTAVGNHENPYNFSNYRNRFSMPGGDGEGLFYSFDYGPAHIVIFSSEFYFFLNQGLELIAKQKLWLMKDFEAANKNRAERPWLIVQSHRPMYCSNNDDDDCSHFEGILRFALEDTLYEAGVDMYISAHEHSYERAWPIYDRKICNGSYDHPYTDPSAPVHIITGSAGMQSGHDAFEPEVPFWSAYRTQNYGYSRLHITNATHMLVEWVDDEQDGKVTDSIWVIKNKHGAGTYDCHLKEEKRW